MFTKFEQFARSQILASSCKLSTYEPWCVIVYYTSRSESDSNDSFGLLRSASPRFATCRTRHSNRRFRSLTCNVLFSATTWYNVFNNVSKTAVEMHREETVECTTQINKSTFSFEYSYDQISLSWPWSYICHYVFCVWSKWGCHRHTRRIVLNLLNTRIISLCWRNSTSFRQDISQTVIPLTYYSQSSANSIRNEYYEYIICWR